ncbi:MAG: hypothetical protein IPK80_00710 [Nannocystis sp.]|nr:hypothetical protein [Nannocystis sp.]
MLYGQGAIPLTIPAALCAVAGLRHLSDPAAHRAYRRLGLLLALGGVLVLAKDARRAPDPVAAPLAPSPHSVDASAHPGLAPLAQHAQLALVVPPSSRESRAASAAASRPGSPRPSPPPRSSSRACGSAITSSPQLSEQRSLQRPLARFAAWSAAGQLPRSSPSSASATPPSRSTAPPARPALPTREAPAPGLIAPPPSAALCRASELASLYAAAWAAARPFYVLDRGHREAVLIANRLPEGATDHNPLLSSSATPRRPREPHPRPF